MTLPPWLGRAGSVLHEPQHVPLPAESLQAFPGAAFSLMKGKWPEEDSSSQAASSLHTRSWSPMAWSRYRTVLELSKPVRGGERGWRR